MSATCAIRAMPGLPGAACISGPRGLAARVSTIAFTALGTDPLYYRLVPLGSDADHAQRSPDLGLHEPHEVLRRPREIPAHPAPGDVLSPAGELLVDGPGVVQGGLVHRVSLDPPAVYLVADAD